MFSLAYFRRNEPALKGQRVHMRLPKSRDFREWAALRGESRSFLEPWEPRWTPDELDRSGWRLRLKRYREDFRLGTAVPFFIFDNETGKLVGGVTLGNIRHGVSQSGHIGYWIGVKHAGKGFMVEAVQLLTAFAFETLRLHRIEAACIPDNARSIRVLEKAGFRREGLLRSYLRINGVWQDHYLYAMIADDHAGGGTKG
ncbi:MAG TPA: GNAT family protein [Rhizobiaceae bacterium]|jgi:ribosomal-protein-alanine N-acetyltransferase|nr:GNAT family protein [Rhizobiaceae bacterium]